MDIKIPVCYYNDKDGNKIYDYDAMAEEFENELNKLTGSSTVMCSISDDITYED